MIENVYNTLVNTQNMFFKINYYVKTLFQNIFLYLSILSLIGVYFFALGKTNNFIKSISFVLFYLAIKFQIIGLPPHTSLFDEPQNPPLISHAEQRPVSNRYVSIYDQPTHPRLYMNKLDYTSKEYVSAESESAINQLRAGESRVTEAAWLLLTIWMLHHQGVGSFQQPIVKGPPQFEAARALLFGPAKPDHLFSKQCSRFDSDEQFKSQQVHMNQTSSTDSKTITFSDGSVGKLKNAVLDHILVKHGHQWGILDIDRRATAEANEKQTKYQQIRTRLTAENRSTVCSNIQNLANSSKLEYYSNYPISGGIGRAYLCPDTALFIGIDQDNIIRKAYLASRNLIDYLNRDCR